ncbi:MAG: hypothetical protein WCX48_08155 [Bacteroidales bacterium]
MEVEGFVLVVKYFKKITLANKFIYAHVRKSKARRAYEHSELLLSKGFTSPLLILDAKISNERLFFYFGMMQ